MKIQLLTPEAYERISKLEQVLHKQDRGYGIVEIEIYGILFGLPLRSNMNHKHGFKTVYHNGKWNGIDYSKAIIVNEDDLQKDNYFVFRNKSEHVKIRKNKIKIKIKFEKYLTDYIHFPKDDPKKVFDHFGYTTLINYHKELGI